MSLSWVLDLHPQDVCSGRPGPETLHSAWVLDSLLVAWRWFSVA